MAVTYESASRCPKCDTPGEQVKLTDMPKSARLPLGTKLAMIECRNPRCKWYNTPWPVQINPDGSVPDPTDHTSREKLYTGIEGHDEMASRLIANLKADAERETQANAEYRGRRL